MFGFSCWLWLVFVCVIVCCGVWLRFLWGLRLAAGFVRLLDLVVSGLCDFRGCLVWLLW